MFSNSWIHKNTKLFELLNSSKPWIYRTSIHLSNQSVASIEAPQTLAKRWHGRLPSWILIAMHFSLELNFRSNERIFKRFASLAWYNWRFCIDAFRAGFVLQPSYSLKFSLGHVLLGDMSWQMAKLLFPKRTPVRDFFAPLVRALLILKIHQENRVLRIYQCFELVYSASFFLHTLASQLKAKNTRVGLLYNDLKIE